VVFYLVYRSLVLRDLILSFTFYNGLIAEFVCGEDTSFGGVRWSTILNDEMQIIKIL